MCEVLKSNFQNYLPTIEKAVRQAEFVAIDTEFTGLQLNDNCKPSLFDSSEERYKKLKSSVSQFLLCQIGVSAFVKNGAENTYSAHSFNFWLFPQSFGPHDVRFQIQASSVAFLCKYNFDFQKMMYDGISFLNGPQEDVVMDSLNKGSLFLGLEREVDEREIQGVCSQVAEQFVRNKEGDTFIVHRDEDAKSCNEYVLHSEIRNRFPGVWTHTDNIGNLVVEVVTSQRREQLEAESLESRKQQEQQLLNTLLGFTRVFRILTEYKKEKMHISPPMDDVYLIDLKPLQPLVGHNMLMDLMFMYDKFFQPLPNKYKEFKNNLHLLFPRIYDTKHISSVMKKPLEDMNLLNSTTLECLYLALNTTRGKQQVLFSPGISHAVGFDRYRDKHIPHEAGYDAFQCGYVFLRLAHIITFKDVKSTAVEPCPFTQYLFALKDFVNRVNVIRATINNICIDGMDPKSRRPELLFVKSRRRRHSLNPEQMAEWFSSFGTVDVRLMSRQCALVATGNYRCAKDILQTFHKHDKIRVMYYSVWRHSPVARAALWTGVAVSGGVCLWILLSSIKLT